MFPALELMWSSAEVQLLFLGGNVLFLDEGIGFIDLGNNPKVCLEEYPHSGLGFFVV